MRPTNLPKPARVGGLALAALVLVGAGVFYVLDDGSEKAPRVELVATRRGTVTAAVSAAGNTVDERTRELAFGGSGTVKKVYVRAGDKVRRGEVLATIGSAPARERYTAAKAQLAAAQEALDNAETQSASPTPATQGQSSGQSQGQSQAQGQGSQAQGQGQPGGAQCPPTAQTPPPGGTATPNPSPGRSRTAEPDRTLVPGGTSTPTPAVPDITPTAAPSGGAGRMGAVVPAGYLVKTGPTAVPTPTPTPTVRTKRHGGGSGHPAPEVTVTVTVTATVTVTTTPPVTPPPPPPPPHTPPPPPPPTPAHPALVGEQHPHPPRPP
ncbi:biotin/lipoyl-binding protein, partial [Streptosporangium saharense]|uniref:biotin/lipoyl-binding protein n=1 Tax=Streptosporangium saharense TaxID=1706840 RepID=UPI0036A2FA83